MPLSQLESWTATGDTKKNCELQLWDLASAKPFQYLTVFNRCVEPKLLDFRGRRFNGIVLRVHGGIFGKIGLVQYVGGLRDLLVGSLFSQQMTFQKRFLAQDNDRGESGINYWPVLGIEAMPMKIYVSSSTTTPSKNSLKVDYNVPFNMRILQRPIIDEIVEIPNSRIYLGRMFFRLSTWHIPFLWFALERLDSTC